MMRSDVPAHHRATGHVRHDAAVRPGGGAPKAAGEPHRLEHLAQFVDDVANRLPATGRSQRRPGTGTPTRS